MASVVTRDGSVVSPVLDDESACSAWLLRHQSMSTSWAMKYEGYDIVDATRLDEPFRLLLADGEMRGYATADERDGDAQRLADETGAWVGVESYDGLEWWLERVVDPTG